MSGWSGNELEDSDKFDGGGVAGDEPDAENLVHGDIEEEGGRVECCGADHSTD